VLLLLCNLVIDDPDFMVEILPEDIKNDLERAFVLH